MYCSALLLDLLHKCNFKELFHVFEIFLDSFIYCKHDCFSTKQLWYKNAIGGQKSSMSCTVSGKDLEGVAQHTIEHPHEEIACIFTVHCEESAV